MAETKKTQAEIKAEALKKVNEDKRQVILENLLMNVGRKDWRDAKAAIELEDGEDYANFIMAAHSANRDLSWEELDAMGFGALARAIWPVDILPDEFKA